MLKDWHRLVKGKAMKILIVDDEEPIRELIKLTLDIENIDNDEAADGYECIKQVEINHYDLILLDVMLPGIDGFNLMKKLREKNIPVIFLTAKTDLQDKVTGLKLGADDYITKPFEPIELLARIETVIRRYNRTSGSTSHDNAGKDSDNLKYRNIDVDILSRTVRKNGNPVDLTAKEFDLLVFFIENQNQVFSREQLLSNIWGYDYYGESRTVDVHIKGLRAKLDLKDALDTVYRVGYKLLPEKH